MTNEALTPYYINHEIANGQLLHWQGGYGVVSFGSKDLQWVLGYVRNQRDHHSNNDSQDRLERIEAINGAGIGDNRLKPSAIGVSPVNGAKTIGKRGWGVHRTRAKAPASGAQPACRQAT